MKCVSAVRLGSRKHCSPDRTSESRGRHLFACSRARVGPLSANTFDRQKLVLIDCALDYSSNHWHAAEITRPNCMRAIDKTRARSARSRLSARRGRRSAAAPTTTTAIAPENAFLCLARRRLRHVSQHGQHLQSALINHVNGVSLRAHPNRSGDRRRWPHISSVAVPRTEDTQKKHHPQNCTRADYHTQISGSGFVKIPHRGRACRMPHDAWRMRRSERASACAHPR